MGLASAAQRQTVWSMEEAQEALVECHELWRRSPGAGRWPFAGDGPWHLMQGEQGDYAGDGQDAPSSSARPRSPLSAAEVTERDSVTAWLEWVADDLDRALVHHVTHALWQGERHTLWRDAAKRLRWGKSLDALTWRYRKALALITCRLNGVPTRRAREMAQRFRVMS